MRKMIIVLLLFITFINICDVSACCKRRSRSCKSNRPSWQYMNSKEYKQKLHATYVAKLRRAEQLRKEAEARKKSADVKSEPVKSEVKYVVKKSCDK